MVALPSSFSRMARRACERLGIAVPAQVVVGLAQIARLGQPPVGGIALFLDDGNRALVGLRGFAVSAPLGYRVASV
jgi:hypothetical protein